MAEGRLARVARVVLSSYVTNGLSAALGLLLISGCTRLALGSFASAAASIGVIVVVPPDQPAPCQGKFRQLMPSVLIGVPLFFAVRMLHADPLRLGLLLVPATFVAFLGAAWGRRGIPVSISAMFAIVFAMAVPARAESAAELPSTVYFALGAVSYLAYATAANSLLNARYRVQILAEGLLSVAALIRTQARQFALDAVPSGAPNPIGQLIRDQAALADQLQGVRDMLLESPGTPRRQQLAGMLVRILEMRDQLLACELDVDLLIGHPHQAPGLAVLRDAFLQHAAHIEKLADALLTRREPAAFDSARTRLEHLPWASDPGQPSAAAPSPDMLARGLAARVANIGEEIAQLTALARGQAEPELAVVRASWQMFISPAAWSWQPIKGLWQWDAPPLRHAIRAALAIAVAYAISLAVPWGTHAYWILLTIVVVLRGSLAQTLERRNSRVAGTLLGSVIAGALLSWRVPSVMLMVIVTLAQGVAHAFAVQTLRGDGGGGDGARAAAGAFAECGDESGVRGVRAGRRYAHRSRRGVGIQLCVARLGTHADSRAHCARAPGSGAACASESGTGAIDGDRQPAGTAVAPGTARSL